MLAQVVMETLTVYSPLLNLGDASRQISDGIKSGVFFIKLARARKRRVLVRRNLLKKLPPKRLDLYGNYYVH
jgi:hypothetical protein